MRYLEYVNSLNIYKLKERGMLSGSQSNCWLSRTRGEIKSEIEIDISLLGLWVNPRFTVGERSFDYRINLVKTACNYGGGRYWFVCPSCSNKYATLHMDSDYHFYCRKCLGLLYTDQTQSKRRRGLGAKGIIPLGKELEEIRTSIKYPFRNGKSTRKTKKYFRLRDVYLKGWGIVLDHSRKELKILDSLLDHNK